MSSDDTPTRLGSGPPRYSLQYDSQRLHTLSLLSDRASVFESMTTRKIESLDARKRVSRLAAERPENLPERAMERQTKYGE